MEVHHHAHTDRKKWHHYFWEFFMLFLAVTLGFMVENMREHYIEHKRAKVYANAMIKNLRTDSAELSQIIYRGEFAVNYLDSFLTLLYNNPLEKIPSGKLYWYGLWGGYLRGFEPNDATFQQMKNSGSLRYFSSDLEEAVSQYDQLLRSMRTLNEIDRPVYLETRKARSRLFDFRYNNDANIIAQSFVYTNYNQDAIDSFINTNPPLLSKDKILFNKYAELCRSRNIRQQLINEKQVLELGKKIIEALKKEYHLN
jgi:hypothetical protein